MPLDRVPGQPFGALAGHAVGRGGFVRWRAGLREKNEEKMEARHR